MDVKLAAKAALTVTIGVAENDGVSCDVLAADPNEKADGNSGAEATLNKGFSKTRNENAFKKVAAHCALIE